MCTKKKLVSFVLVLALVFGVLGCFAMSAAAAPLPNPLTPDDITVYTKDGTTPLAVLSKTAKRTAADTWQVNLNVKALNTIKSKPLYMEFALDNSGSMHQEQTKIGDKHRLDVMKESMCDVLDVLSVSSADIYIHVTTFNGNVSDLNIGQSGGANKNFLKLTPDNVESVKNYINNIGYANNTNISGALQNSFNVLTQGTTVIPKNAVRVMTIMGDGAPNDANYHPAYSQNSYPSRFWASGIVTYSITFGSAELSSGDMFLRSLAGNPKYNADGTVISNYQDAAYYNANGVGITGDYYYPADKVETYSKGGTTYYYVAGEQSYDDKFILNTNNTSYSVDNRFKYDINNHFTAADGSQLAIAFREIATKAVAMVIDPAGGGFGDVKVQSVNGNYSEIDDILDWTPSTVLNEGDSYSIVYTETLDVDNIDMSKGFEGVFTNQKLNGETRLKFTYHDDDYEFLFPVPQADFKIAELQVNYYYDTLGGTPFATESVRKIIDYDEVTFGYKVPEAVASVDGTHSILNEGKSRYQGTDLSNYKDSVILLPGIFKLDLVYDKESTKNVKLNLVVNGKGGEAALDTKYSGALLQGGKVYFPDGVTDGTATVKVEPDYGYKVNSVTVTKGAGTTVTADNSNVYGDKTYTVSGVKEDSTITVTFAPLKTVKVTSEVSGGNGTVSPGTYSVFEGSDVEFTAAPNTNYVVDTATLSDTSAGTVAVNGNAIGVKNVTKNVTVTVKFKIDGNEVTYKGFNGSGDVPEGNPVADRKQAVPTGKTLTVVPNGGSWKDAGAVFGTADKVYTDADAASLTAELTENEIIGDPEPPAVPAGAPDTAQNLFMGWQKTVDASGNVTLTAQYEYDVNGDNVPDSVQKKVTYKIVNGLWSTDDDEDKTEFVTLTKSSKWDINGSGNLANVPTGTARPGWKNFKEWSPDTPSNSKTVTGKDDLTYTLSFNQLDEFDVVYIKGDYATGDSITDKKKPGIDLQLRNSDEVTFVRPGYYIVGWSFRPDGSTKDYNLKAMYSADEALLLYPVWNPEPVNVSFNELQGPADAPEGLPQKEFSNSVYDKSITVIPNGGTYYDTNNIFGGGAYTAYTSNQTAALKGDTVVVDPEAPADMMFIGWIVENEDGNLTYTAYYAEDKVQTGNTPAGSDNIPDMYQVKVTYKVEGGTWDSITAIDYSEYVTLLDAKGNWNKEGSGKLAAVPDTAEAQPDGAHQGSAVWEPATPVNGTTAVTEDTAYTYIFKEAKTYTVTYRPGAKGSGEIEAGTKIHNVDFTLTTERFTRTGYSQVGWTATDGADKDFYLGGIYADNENLTLYPVWEPGKVTVGYNEIQNNGDSVPAPAVETTDAGKKLNVVTNGGTYVDVEGIFGNGLEHVFESTAEKTLENDENIHDATAPEKKVFIGWEKEVTDGNITLTAQYADDKDEDGIPDYAEVTVTYTILNGTWADDTVTNKTETVPLLTVDGKWDVNGIGKLAEVPTGMKADEYYKANGKWTEGLDTTPIKLENGHAVTDATEFHYTYLLDSYTVSYFTDVNTKTGTDASFTVPKNEDTEIAAYSFTRTGYTQVGWAITEGGAKAYNADDTYTNRTDLDLYPVWLADDLDVKFAEYQDSNSDGVADSAPTDTVKGSKYDKELLIDAKEGLYEGFPTKTVSLTENLEVGTPLAPDGKIFVGWEPFYDAEGDVVRLNAHYEADANGDNIPDAVQKEVTYKVVNGTWNDGKAADQTELVTLTKDGIWDPAGSALLANVPTDMEADDGHTEAGAWDVTPAPESGVTEVTGMAPVTYTYTFDTLKTFTVTYDKGANGEGAIASGTKTYGIDYPLTHETFTRDGFAQSGWATEDGGEKVYDLSDIYAKNADITLYPTWVSHPVTVFYSEFRDNEFNDGTVDNFPDNLPRDTSVITETGCTLTVVPNGGTYKDAEGIFGTADEEYAEPVNKILTHNETIVDPIPDANYMFVGWQKTESDDNITLTAQYALDADGDNIPDAVEQSVTYKVKNGTWADDSVADLTEDIILTKEGKWAANGTAALAEVPTGMKAAEFYKEEGTWNVDDLANGYTVNGGETFVYTFVIDEYTVTFDPGAYGENIIAPATVDLDKDYTVNGVLFTREGYKQIGWATEAEGEKIYESKFVYTGRADITLYPVWIPKAVAVTYPEYRDDNYNGIPDGEPADGKTGAHYDNTLTVDPNGGSYTDAEGIFGTADAEYTEPVSKTLTNDEAIGTPDAPEKTVFVGWQTITDKKGNITLRAVYVPDENEDSIPDAVQKVVTFRVVNGTWADDSVADIVEYVTLKVADEWSDDKAAVGVIEDVPEGMKADYAHKAPGSWDMKGVADGMEVTDTDPVIFTYTFTAPSEFTVTYDAGEGEGTIASQTKIYDVDLDLTKDVFTRTGYTQVGWATEKGGEKVYNLFATYTENKNITLYPVWEANAITVDYNQFIDVNSDKIADRLPEADTINTFSGKTLTIDAGTGDYTGPNPGTLNADVDVTDPTPVSGEIFVGWISTVDEATGNITLVAQYETDDNDDVVPDCVQKDITYVIVNGTWDGFDALAQSEVVTLTDKDGNWNPLGSGKLAKVPDVGLAVPAEGYDTAAQWTASDDSIAPAMDKVVTKTDAVTYTYTFGNLLTYDIVYVGDSHSTDTVAPGVKTYDVDYDLATDTFKRTGYTQTAWTKTEGGEKDYELGATYKENADLTLYPVWTPDDVDITYNEYPGTDTPETYPAENTETSKYDRTLTINPNGGIYNDTTENTVMTLTEDILVKDPTAPEKQVFIGWEKTVDPDTKDVTLTAQYAPDVNEDNVPDTVQKVVTYKVVNGTFGSSEDTEAVEYVTLWKDGKWSAADDAEGTLQKVPVNMQPDEAHIAADAAWDVIPAPESTVTTVYGMEPETYTYTFGKAKTYTVTYLPGTNGEGTIEAGTKVHGVDFTLTDETFTREGYEQTGWALSEGGQKEYDLEAIYKVDKDLTLYPVWEEIVLDLTFNEFPDENEDNTPDGPAEEQTYPVPYDKTLTIKPNGGTYEGSTTDVVTTLTADKVVTDPVAPEGEMFTGWKQDVDHLGNVTLIAQYAPDANDDNIPDGVQKKVTYKVVNGTWGESGKEDIVEYVTLSKDGKWNENGQGTLTQVPTNMRPEPNCGNGRWVSTIPADYVVKGIDPVTYSYTFEHNADPGTGKPIATFTGTEDGNGDGQLDNSQLEMEKGATLTADLNGGTWEGKGWTKNPDGTWSIDVNQNLNVPDPDAREGYQFGGWAVTGPDKDGNYRITALWTELETKVEVKVAGDLADKVKVNPASLDDVIDKVVDEEIRDGKQLKKVEVVMTVKNHDSSADTAANAIKAIADGRTLEYFDIIIDKIVTYAVWDGTSWTASAPVTTNITSTPEIITVELPYDDAGKKDFAAYRYLDGKGASEMGLGERNKNKDGEYFSLNIGSFDVNAKNFKTFAIGYYLTGTHVPGALDGDDHVSYIIGRSDGLIHPESNLTRAEAATIFFRLLKDEYRVSNLTTENNYPDVNEGQWFNTAISTLSKMGILNGDKQGNFRPNANITRAEFAAIAQRFDGKDASGSIAFKDIEGHWAAEEITRAAEIGWVSGYSDGNFYPNNNIRRAEAITLINRVVERIPRSTADLLPDMKTWPDNADTNVWYYLAIQEATNSHEFNRYSDGTETWTALKANPDWSAIEK